MYRTNTCGELRIENVGQEVTLAGWVQKNRKLGGMVFIDLRDRYGVTQLTFNIESNSDLVEVASHIGREYVIQVTGKVSERTAKNPAMATGDIEVEVSSLSVLNKSLTPPFTIETNTDGGDELRMKYRYLDLRREAVRGNLELRHRMAIQIRSFLDNLNFMEVETPVLIKSTPEGARDFVVPSRMNPGEFYALPQSPQTFKQLLMVAGFDRYFQIVKCFRDEDLRADRQPEFTQIDCEMSFVEQEDILDVFEKLSKHLFKTILNIDQSEAYPRISWHDAMKYYGSDKPDTRFDMKIVEVDDVVKGAGFKVFDEAKYIGGICVLGGDDYSRKQIDALTDYVKSPQIGAEGLVYVRIKDNGTFKSSIDKFYSPEKLQELADKMSAKPGDLILIISGDNCMKSRQQLGALRLEVAKQQGLMKTDDFSCLWVVDFPLLEWNDEDGRYYAMHHPFTAPKPEDIPLLDSDPGKVRANAYDMVINGVEVGGGSIRIHDSKLQEKMFEVLGFTPEKAQEQFGFLMNAFQYGAPPHGGIAYGFDRWVSLFAGISSIRDTIAFPKNNSGRDVMINAPSHIDEAQLDELFLDLKPVQHK